MWVPGVAGGDRVGLPTLKIGDVARRTVGFVLLRSGDAQDGHIDGRHCDDHTRTDGLICDFG